MWLRKSVFQLGIASRRHIILLLLDVEGLPFAIYGVQSTESIGVLVVVRLCARLENAFAGIYVMEKECDPDAEEVMNLHTGFQRLVASLPSCVYTYRTVLHG